MPCRLLDIQELLSDTGVGRQQHVIVSQGQIDAVLNARPEERRSIIEEAAGVLKYRQRKEKSERRLEATEGNLTRLQDLLREVRRQLRPLERQADAARRHGEVVAELTALRLHLAGREIAGLRTRLEGAAQRRIELGATDRDLKAELAAPRHRGHGHRGPPHRHRRRRPGRRPGPGRAAARTGPGPGGVAGRAAAGHRPRPGRLRRPG